MKLIASILLTVGMSLSALAQTNRNISVWTNAYVWTNAVVIPVAMTNVEHYGEKFIKLGFTPNYDDPDILGYRVFYGTQSHLYINYLDLNPGHNGWGEYQFKVYGLQDTNYFFILTERRKHDLCLVFDKEIPVPRKALRE